MECQERKNPQNDWREIILKDLIHNLDYGDDIKDFERKDRKAWMNEFDNNPIYNGYR